MPTNPPQATRSYIHCIRCHVPLERPRLKRVETELWYCNFAVCSDCKEAMLAMANPSVTMQIDGDCLKELLQAKSNQVMMANCLKGE